MGIENIKQRILDKAKSEASLLISKEKEKIKEEKKAFEEQQKLLFSQKEEKELEKIQSELKKRIEQENLKKDRLLLEKKKYLLDKFFLEIEEKIADLPEKQYKEFLVDLILRDAPKGRSLLFVREKDKKLFTKKLLLEINNKLGNDREIILSEEPANIKGGFILKGAEVEIDDSVEMLVKDLREKEEIVIAKKLFGET
jgi:V/A-type H+-transporting ATPase subunit E